MKRAVLIEEIARLQKRIGQALHQSAPEAWLGLDLTIGQLKSLFFIDHEGTTNFRKLAQALNVTPPNVTVIIDRLVEQGLVSREENPEDRRMLLLKTTEKAKTLLATLRENQTSHISGVLTQMSLEDLSALLRGLGALATAIETGKKKSESNKSR
jgi:MarR family transcriptional regulator, organic hydroperoxide resistance regulator